MAFQSVRKPPAARSTRQESPPLAQTAPSLVAAQEAQTAEARGHRFEDIPAHSPARPAPHRDSLPAPLRAGVEALSGVDLSDVRVHFNSSRPHQFGALAYTQGNHIHVRPGQESHLPHEAWHVVQQRQGRVTADERGLNEEPGLEHEAEALGARASQLGNTQEPGAASGVTAPRASSPPASATPAAIQCYKTDGPKNPGAYLQQHGEKDDAYRERMRQEMAQLRQTMQEKDEDPLKREDHDVVDVPATLLRKPSSAPPREPSKTKKKHPERSGPPLPTPTVGISNRPGFGYDKSVFDKAGTSGKVGPGNRKFPHLEVNPTSLPPGFEALPERASEKEAKQRDAEVRAARVPETPEDEADPQQKWRDMAKAHLSQVSGLYIPGGQDRGDNLEQKEMTDEEFVEAQRVATEEKTTREQYEQALIHEARNRGMPTLAVCGGSRCLARGFGAEEDTLSEPQQAIHSQRTSSLAHGLQLPEPHSLLGSAAPDTRAELAKQANIWPSGSRATSIDAVNSTHTKVVKNVGGNIEPVNKLSSGEPELITSAKDPDGNPEGFETRYGAPILGVTSHPEAIFGSGSARKAATPSAVQWSDNILKGFRQSMQAYAAKQATLEEIRKLRK